MDMQHYHHVFENRPLLRVDDEGVPKLTQFVKREGYDWAVWLFNGQQVVVSGSECKTVDEVEVHVNWLRVKGFLSEYLGERNSTITVRS